MAIESPSPTRAVAPVAPSRASVPSTPEPSADSGPAVVRGAGRVPSASTYSSQGVERISLGAQGSQRRPEELRSEAVHRLGAAGGAFAASVAEADLADGIVDASELRAEVDAMVRPPFEQSTARRHVRALKALALATAPGPADAELLAKATHLERAVDATPQVTQVEGPELPSMLHPLEGPTGARAQRAYRSASYDER